MYVYYDDGTTSQWVDASPQGLVSVITSDTAPSSPNDGAFWYDSVGGRTYIYYNDGNTTQWVDASPQQTGPQTSIASGNTTAQVTDTGSDGRFVVTTEGTERLRVDSSGRVGIGTTSPSQTLQVVSSSGGTTGRFVNNSGNFIDFITSTDGSRMGYLGHVSATDMYVHNDKNGPIIFDTNNTERARIDSSGRLLVGTSTSLAGTGSLKHEVANGNSATSTFVANAFANSYQFVKSRSTSSLGTVVQNGDELGNIDWYGDDGTGTPKAGARVQVFVDGTPGANDMPGRLVFSTTADGSSSPTERMRITNAGRIGLAQSSPATTVDVNGSYASNITAVAALDIDCTLGNFFTKTINANSTFTFSNPPSSRSYSFSLELTHTSGAVTWPASVVWPSGTAPTLTTGKVHLFMFVTDDAGTRWRGAALVDYAS
jgi:hypothetical protein